MKTIDTKGFQRVACPYQEKVRIWSDQTDLIAAAGGIWCRDYCRGFVSMKNDIVQCKMDDIIKIRMDKKSNTISHLLYEGIKKVIRKIFNI